MLAFLLLISSAFAGSPFLYPCGQFGNDLCTIQNGGFIVNYLGDTSNRGILYMNSAPAGGDAHVAVDNAGIESVGFNGRFLKGNSGGNTATWADSLWTFVSSHIRSTRATPPVPTVDAHAGTGATCAVSNASDIAGTINLTTTAVAPGSGSQCSIAFNTSYVTAPICVVTPVSAASATQAVLSGDYFTTTTGTLVVNFSNSDATGHTYNWAYHCVETQ